MNLKQSTLLSYFGECSVAIEALQVSCVVDCNSLWYENLDDRKFLQGTNISLTARARQTKERLHLQIFATECFSHYVPF